MQSLKYIDTFCGVGGFRLGIEQACAELGIKATCVASIDKDPKCRKTYEKNFGDAPLGDITQIDLETLADHDILVGGFPCQPFSRNGQFYNKAGVKDGKKRPAGTVCGSDERVNLKDYLLKILVLKQPSYFVFENVKEFQTILGADGTSIFSQFLEELSRAGYSTYHRVLDAADFGLPQQRQRIFFVGIRKDLDRKFYFPDPIPLKQSVKDILEPKVDAKYLLENMWKTRKNTRIKEWSRLQTLELFYAKGVPIEIQKIIAKNDDKNVMEKKFNKFFALWKTNVEDVEYKKIWMHPLDKTTQIVPLAVIYGETPSGLPRQQDKLYSVLGISPTIATFSTPNFATDSGWRQLTPRECFNLQGFPKDYILPDRDTVAYHHAGNAVAVAVIKHIFLSLLNPTYIPPSETGKTGTMKKLF